MKRKNFFLDVNEEEEKTLKDVNEEEEIVSRRCE